MGDIEEVMLLDNDESSEGQSSSSAGQSGPGTLIAVNLKCLNKFCRKSSSDKLWRATQSAVLYFQKHYSEEKMYFICEKCQASYDEYCDKLVTLVEDGKSLFEHKLEKPADVIDIDSVEFVSLEENMDLVDVGDLPKYETFKMEEDLDPKKVIEEFLEGFNLESLTNPGLEILGQEVKEWKEMIAQQHQIVAEMERSLAETIRAHNRTLGNPYTGKVPGISIDGDRVTELSVSDDSQDLCEIFEVTPSTPRGPSTSSSLNTPRPPIPGSCSRISTSKSNAAISEDQDIQQVFETSNPQQDMLLPEDGIKERVHLKKGDYVYVMTKGFKEPWKRGKVTDVYTKLNNTTLYQVSCGSIRKLFSLKHLAYIAPAAVIVRRGVRVIANYKDENAVDVGFYAGIVAESPRAVNQFRYLIFFDDGYAQYSSCNDLRVVCDQSERVWEDVDPSALGFIKTYLCQFPERPMVRLKPGDTVRAKHNQNWYETQVLKVDYSLALLKFRNSEERIEWIYRGSMRLEPLYHEMSQRSRAQIIQRRTVATVVPNVRSVAKKSTSKKVPQTYVEHALDRTTTSREKVTAEYDGVVQSVEGLKKPTQIKYEPHWCGPSCIQDYPYDCDDPEFRTINQFCVPIRLGWDRFVVTRKNGKTKTNKVLKNCDRVVYRAPCGRTLRNTDEVFNFLRITNATLPIDMFTSDTSVRIGVEFKPKRVLYESEDITNGKERMKISCINSIDFTGPPYVEYSTVRLPTARVKAQMHLDPEFLSCCSCEDDCLDSENCECQKLTIQGVQEAEGVRITNCGYNNRRLQEQISTGIYECNSRCSCKDTCLNRVVQFPLRARLQLFKTNKRGWGIRTLDDLPPGSFISIYVGQLLADDEANMAGKMAGDEYFADLDFIEVAQTAKDGYESNVPSDDEEKDPDVYSDNGKKKKRPKGLFGTKRRKKVEKKTEQIKKKEKPTTKKKFITQLPMFKKTLRKRNPPTSEKPSNSKSSAKKEPSTSKQAEVVIASVEERKKTRKYFGDDELPYTIDAKSVGNIGRYLNHSCDPNVFVQNVFVDTHDLRFPWVAFFANCYIPAGSELTWDYQYEIGNVPNKHLTCHCGADNCRGRLL
ncbi:histone-lysine N-methyltransferase SETDB1-like isoform X2 [Artemia franciscana]|uniref:histone-lysine N-methyltransferase SETDB1-like isoform X2 n=1 Tax=Artemia franciscana TaxID=6661 RepID=UPI0032DB920E